MTPPIDLVARATAQSRLRLVLDALSVLRPRGPELVAQDAIADALGRVTVGGEPLPWVREPRLSPGDRLDFIVGKLADTAPAWIAIEVKTQGSLTEVTRQLHRYAQDERIAALILVTTRMRHRAVPRSLNVKPVYVVHLIGSSL